MTTSIMNTAIIYWPYSEIKYKLVSPQPAYYLQKLNQNNWKELIDYHKALRINNYFGQSLYIQYL